MIKILTIAKSDDPSLHLNFWKENLKLDYPVIEIKKSNLKMEDWESLGLKTVFTCQVA